MQPELHEKAWGYELWLANTQDYCGKRLILHKGWRCSMHHHKQKDETFYVAAGQVFIETASLDFSRKQSQLLITGETVRILPETWHRFSGVTEAELIEISTHHDDADSYRQERSGRIPKAEAAYYAQLAATGAQP